MDTRPFSPIFRVGLGTRLILWEDTFHLIIPYNPVFIRTPPVFLGILFTYSSQSVQLKLKLFYFVDSTVAHVHAFLYYVFKPSKSHVLCFWYQGPVKSHALHIIMTHAIDSFYTLTHKPGLFSHIFVHAWSQDMASSFTSIRDRRIKMPRVLGHYLLCKSSLTTCCGPTL